MSDEITGHVIHSVGVAGAADDGKIVHFELVGPDGQKQRFLVPYEHMGRVLLTLQGAMQMATEENARRPGFNLAQSDTRLGLRSHGTSLAVASGEESLVVLHLQPEFPTSFALMLPPAQAKQLGNDLIRRANEIAATPPPIPS